jgi:hypothetical protein
MTGFVHCSVKMSVSVTSGGIARTAANTAF